MPFGLGHRRVGSEAPVQPGQGEKGSDEAPGWDAIGAALGEVFPGEAPIHWGTNRLPGQDGLYGLSAYCQGGAWFFVTFGLSELFSKESDNPDLSGWGFELTIRVAGNDAEPPAWPRALLDRLGDYVFSSGLPFAAGHRMDVVSPITGGNPPTRLTCLAFAPDPQLGTIETPNGSLAFLTVIGITPEELTKMKAASTAAVLDEMSPSNPLLVTDPRR